MKNVQYVKKNNITHLLVKGIGQLPKLHRKANLH